MKSLHYLSIASILVVSSCKEKEPAVDAKPSFSSIDTSYMNTNVAACEDFFEYANGTWIKNNPIPETESSWSAFHEVRDRNNALLKKILQDCAADKNATAGSNRQKIGTYFNSAMDSTKLEADGITPLLKAFENIDKISDLNSLSEYIAYQNSRGINTPFHFYVEQDLKQNDQYISSLSQSGLTLPDKDYYFSQDPSSKTLREELMKHMEKKMVLAGFSEADAKKNQATIFKIETALAKASLNATEQRDMEKQYNKMSLDELKKLTSNFNWDLFIKAIGMNNPDFVIVAQPDFMKNFNGMLKSVSIVEWKAYFKWHLLDGVASTLNNALEEEHFAFNGTILSGAKKMKPRWERTLNVMNYQLGEAIGQEYVKEAFSAETKERLNKMVDNLLLAMKERITASEWMGEETKKNALEKISTFTKKIGYPDKWKDYSSFEVTSESYMNNYLNGNLFYYQENLKKLGKPIDKSEWHMSPQTVNAYYNPPMNEIVFPAGILQPPFMMPDAEDAVMYASIGAVIGHEITHGFDDQGSQFDATGNMKNWWTEADMTNFMSRANIVVKQYSEYKPLEDLAINGELTLGENIADQGGLAMAYHAFMKTLEGKEKETVMGYTPEQRFFIAYGQVWKSIYKEASLRQQLLTNPHSPGKYRVLGTLSNMEEFYTAFECKEGNPMHRADSMRAKIW